MGRPFIRWVAGALLAQRLVRGEAPVVLEIAGHRFFLQFVPVVGLIVAPAVGLIVARCLFP